MTRQDFMFKWFLYGLGVLPVWIFETMILNRLPLFGIVPLLLPLAAIAVAVKEGAAAGAGFGLFVGLIADAVYPGISGGMTLGLSVAGALSGAAAQYVLRQNYVTCLLCSAATLLALDGVRVILQLISGAALGALLRVAGAEIFWSLCWTLPVYGLFHLISNKVGGSRLA
ncbi:MAG: rod shape-determining protein MreD [Oscillospiraceae bacterium]